MKPKSQPAVYCTTGAGNKSTQSLIQPNVIFVLSCHNWSQAIILCNNGDDKWQPQNRHVDCPWSRHHGPGTGRCRRFDRCFQTGRQDGDQGGRSGRCIRQDSGGRRCDDFQGPGGGGQGRTRCKQREKKRVIFCIPQMDTNPFRIYTMLRPNDEYIRRLIETVNNSPFPRHLPMKLVSIELDRAVVACETATCHLQPFGIVHGGVLATLIDTATFWSVFMRLPQDAGLVNIDLKLNYLRPVSNGTITARGAVHPVRALHQLCGSKSRGCRRRASGAWHLDAHGPAGQRYSSGRRKIHRR